MIIIKKQSFKTGGGLGSAGGYPQDYFEILNSVDEIASTYDEKATYFRAEEIDVKDIVKTINSFKEQQL